MTEKIEKGLRDFIYADATIKIVDIFVNGMSFESILRKSYSRYFLKPRFLTGQIPILLGGLDNQYLSKQWIKNLLPKIHRSFVTPLYGCADGCADGCCLLWFVDIENTGTHIIWKRVGQFVSSVDDPSYDEEVIDWLPDFKPLHFKISEYLDFYYSFD